MEVVPMSVVMLEPVVLAVVANNVKVEVMALSTLSRAMNDVSPFSKPGQLSLRLAGKIVATLASKEA